MGGHGIAELECLVLAQPAAQTIVVVVDDTCAQAGSCSEIRQVGRAITITDARNTVALTTALIEDLPCIARGALRVPKIFSGCDPGRKLLHGLRFDMEFHVGVLQAAEL